MSNDGNIDTISRLPPLKSRRFHFLFYWLHFYCAGCKFKRGLHFFTIDLILLGDFIIRPSIPEIQHQNHSLLLRKIKHSFVQRLVEHHAGELVRINHEMERRICILATMLIKQILNLFTRHGHVLFPVYLCPFNISAGIA